MRLPWRRPKPEHRCEVQTPWVVSLIGEGGSPVVEVGPARIVSADSRLYLEARNDYWPVAGVFSVGRVTAANRVIGEGPAGLDASPQVGSTVTMRVWLSWPEVRV